jgi:hypothetical protein
VALGSELRQDSPGCVDLTEQRGVHDLTEHRAGSVLEPSVTPHSGVDAPELLNRATGENPHRCLVADVGRDSQPTPAPLLALADHLVQRAATACRQYDARSPGGEGARHPAADAAGGAGDDDDRLIRFAVHGLAGSRARSNTSPVACAWTYLSTMSTAHSRALHCVGR